MLVEKLSEEEICFMEDYHNPVALCECLFSDFNNLTSMQGEDLAHLRTPQYPMLSYEYIIDYDPDLTEKENFALLEGAGNLYNYGARKFGKTLISLMIDMLESIVHLDGWEVIFTSYDAVHIRSVLERIIPVVESHPFYKLLSVHVKRSPTYLLRFNNGFVMHSVNQNVLSTNPGNQFFGHHVKKLWMEEACVDGHTKVRCLDENGKIKTKNISDIINSGLWKSIKVLSYNYEQSLLEWKKVKNVFKKQVKDYINYKITVQPNSKHSKRTLTVSQHQKIWTQKGYKYIEDVKKTDKVYLSQYTSLSNTQKEILVGCLLGDSHLNKKTNCTLSFTHGKKQKYYLDYKKSCFSNIFQTVRNRKNSKFERTFSSMSSSPEKIFRSTSVPNLSLNEFRDFKYNPVNNVYTEVDELLVNKYFSAKSLAFWFMDDGHAKICKNGRVNIQLATCAFTLETNQILQNIIKKKLNLDCNILKNRGYYLAFNGPNSKKFLKLVSKYLTPDLRYKTNIEADFVSLEEHCYNLDPLKIVDIEAKHNSSWTMYDVEIEDNHNFFANEILISNSFETQEVKEKRIDATAELGCIERVSGMTNFIRFSPSGETFYSPDKQPWVLNLPQYINELWDDKEQYKAVQKYGGMNSIGYRVFVKGEVVEEGLSVLDMERVHKCYNREKVVKTFEINKENFNLFRQKLVIERPSNATNCYIAADIGESAPTEIIIMFEINDKFHYVYNITLYNLTDKEQYQLFLWVAQTVSANFVGLDVTNGTGRAIFRRLEEKLPRENLVWVAFNEKLPVDFEKDERDNVIFKGGKPVYAEEYVSEWSVKRLQHLLYNQKFEIPQDFKFDSQINSVVALISGTRTIYKCFEEGTEILTFDGWKDFRDISDKDSFMTWNLKKNETEYQKATNFINLPYSGEMVEYEGTELKYSVTPNHSMLTEKPHNYKRGKSKKEFIDADKMIGESRIFRTFPNWKGKQQDTFEFKNWYFNKQYSQKTVDMKEWLSFLGWFISEGSITHSKGNNYRIAISQSKTVNFESIERCLQVLGIKYCYSGDNFVFNSKWLYIWLQKHCYTDIVSTSHTKKAPSFIRHLSSELIEVFLYSYMLGDGHIKKSGKWKSCCTASQVLANDLQELLLKINKSATISVGHKSGYVNNGTYYIVTISDSVKHSIIKSKNQSIKSYNGNVHCVEVPNHTIYVKYKGKSFWCGNCLAEEDHLFQAFQVLCIMIWYQEFNNIRPILKKTFSKLGC